MVHFLHLRCSRAPYEKRSDPAGSTPISFLQFKSPAPRGCPFPQETGELVTDVQTLRPLTVPSGKMGCATARIRLSPAETGLVWCMSTFGPGAPAPRTNARSED